MGPLQLPVFCLDRLQFCKLGLQGLLNMLRVSQICFQLLLARDQGLDLLIRGFLLLLNEILPHLILLLTITFLFADSFR